MTVHHRPANAYGMSDNRDTRRITVGYCQLSRRFDCINFENKVNDMRQEELAQPMLNPREIAARLKLSLSMVYKILGNGELECYRIGSAYRVSEHQLGRYLDRVKGEAKTVTRIKRHF